MNTTAAQQVLVRVDQARRDHPTGRVDHVVLDPEAVERPPVHRAELQDPLPGQQARRGARPAPACRPRRW